MAGGLKEVRERIKSVGSTQQITKAMKMVSASKLRRAQNAIVQMRPYANRMNRMLSNILSNMSGDGSTKFGTVRPVKTACMVVVTSNRGLCGAFNTNVIKAAIARINESYGDVRRAKNLTIVCIGKRGHDFFRKNYSDCTIVGDHVALFENLAFENVSTVAQILMDSFSNGKFDAVDIAYGRFRNAAMQFPEVEKWLPVPKMEAAAGETKKRADYIFEPDQQQLLENLVPSILKMTFFKTVLDTHASEHGARMTSMDKATENAEELLKNLKIHYNKARQESITRELGEIVGGAAALEGA